MYETAGQVVSKVVTVVKAVYSVGARFPFTSGVLVGLVADTVVRWF